MLTMENILKLIAEIFALVLLYTIAISTYKRWSISRKLPGMKIGFFDIWADVKNFRQKKLLEDSDCKNIQLLQVFSAYTQLFRRQMFFCFWFSVVPVVFIVKAPVVEQLIGNTKHMEKSWVYKFVSQWLQTGLLTSKGQKWKSRRKLITPSFHFDILKDFLPVINEQSQYLVKVFEKETTEDFTDVTLPLTLCTLDVICETTLGVKINAQKNSKSEYVQALLRVASTIMQRLSNPLYFIDPLFNISTLGRQYNKDVKVLHDFTQTVIKQKKAEALSGNTTSTPKKKRKALMDMLLEHHLRDESLSEEDIREEVDTFAFAGHDTSSMGISWALYLIGLYKHVQCKVHEELDAIFGDDTERPVTEDDLRDMKYLECVLKESQRLYPSVPLIGRTSTADTVLNGYKIPEGLACVIYIYELHRDPEAFPDPEKFDPDRFLPENSLGRHPYAYIPFSAGPRNCIGQRFAMMEEKVVVANVLRNYTIESLEPRDKVFPAPEVILRNAKPLKIKIRKRTR